jgi:thiol-disulfide isomerase/thioredoxin
MRFIIWLAGFLVLTACAGTRQIRSLAEFYHPDHTQELVSMRPDLAWDLLQQSEDKPLLIEFSADWCKPCRELVRPLKRLAAASEGRYRVLTVDVTDDWEPMTKFGMEKKLPAFYLKLPHIKEPILRYGSGESFHQIANFLKRDDPPQKVALETQPLAKAQAYKAILVAGSADNANFLQEVYWNYSWLLQKGYQTAEIGCFFAEPDLLQYLDDQKQFDEMKPLIAACHPLKRQQLLDSIRLSLQAQPQNFYLYVSAHGAAPVQEKHVEAYKQNCMALAPALTLDQRPSDCESRQGLTASDLAAVMKEAPNTKKYLVLQGCYTGGYISPEDDPRSAPSPLARLPNMRILTASSAKKMSFGCHSGAQATLFGSAYGMTVIEDKRDLDSMNWPEVHVKVTGEVKKLEKELRLPHRQASVPQFFMN